jgi:hypothetical protein
VAKESAEGLSHGLLYLAESLENGEQHSTNLRIQISAQFEAFAHELPTLLELSEQANHHLLQMQENRVYQS